MSPKLSRSLEQGKKLLSRLRQAPKRLFTCEPSAAYGRRIESLLREIRQQEE